MDYDGDNDNLIDITTLAQLNAIRYDLDGNGRNTGDDAVSYFAAFSGVTQGMGCPATCIGYELLNNLDFDYDEDGSTHAAGVIDSDDAVAATAAYFDSATGWTPIGGHTSTASPYTAIFEGNGNTIDNLYINLSTAAANMGNYVGLFADFGATGSPAIVRNLGLVDPYVKNTRGANSDGIARTGALAGRSNAGSTVSGVSVAGGSVIGEQNATTASGVSNIAGCLLGSNAGTVRASYAATCAASAVGADDASDQAGGLIGSSSGTVSGSYATGTVTAHSIAGGLVADISAGTVITSYATGAVSASGANGRAGGLVGSANGSAIAVSASYAAGAVSVSGATGTNQAGGLLGSLLSGAAVKAAYATGAVSATGTGSGVTNRVGGLVGRIEGSTTTVTASYAIGAVSGSGSGTNNIDGLVGSTANNGAVTNSHWDITVNNGFTAQPNISKTTTELRSPTDYGAAAADAFYNWNIDLDGDSSNDDPWDFGTSSDYPVISYGGISLAAQGRTPVDYDGDNDGLIDIDSLAKLNAVRYDLDGNGNPDGGTGDTAYNAVFANRDRSAAGLMGCPLGDHDDDADTPEQAHCTGYELTANLDFDTDGDGETYAISGGAVTVDADDTNNFFNGNAGWVSIGNDVTGYSGVFEGNGHTIDNLFIHLATDASGTTARVGLFARLDAGGVIRGLGLTDPYVRRQTGSGARYAGALAGESFGTIRATYAAGGEIVLADTAGSGGSHAGGLVGAIGSGGEINASYANVTVRMTGNNGFAGGLAGHSAGGTIAAAYAAGSVIMVNSAGSYVGGLVGSIADDTTPTPDVLATIDASYARGAVSGSGTLTTGRVLAGLVASSAAAARVTNSYYDNTAAGTTQTASPGGGAGKATADLQTPTCYTGDYAGWNVDVDGDGAPTTRGTLAAIPNTRRCGTAATA